VDERFLRGQRLTKPSRIDDSHHKEACVPDIPQLAFPIRVDGNQVAVIEQGSAVDVVGQVQVLCLTPPGWLTHDDFVRGFGLADQSHRKGGADPGLIEDQIERYVPDAGAAVDERPDALNAALSLVGVRLASAS
jgi:hypothetical protein